MNAPQNNPKPFDSLPERPKTLEDLARWNVRLNQILESGPDGSAPLSSFRRFLFETLMMAGEGLVRLSVLENRIVSKQLQEIDRKLQEEDSVELITDEIKMAVDMA